MTQKPASAVGADSGPRRRGTAAFLRDVLVIVVVALLVSFLVKTFLVRSFYIPSGSMENTLLVNDRIIVDEITPDFSGYQRGDVIVFRDPGGWLPPSTGSSSAWPVEAVKWVLSIVGLSAPDSDDHLIKRVIGLPGDHVACCNALGQITVNGMGLNESSYVKLQPGETVPDPKPFDVVVPEDKLWVMGDNRDMSCDSRCNQNKPGRGFVPVSDVVGRAVLITWPFTRFGLIDTHHAVFAQVPGTEKSVKP